ncbi:hypothetical protein BX666DRAFT_1879118 [Dichotomocladium elegans]|nr:hypothetical protein BX666DRAFT_1879118 [Dichotomocladium elegans]
MSSITNTSHSWPLVTTISLTDFVIVIDERITTTSTPLSADEKTSPVTIAISNNEGHSGIPYQLFPFLSVFAIIGIITVLVALGFLGYRFYRSDRRLVHHNDGGTSGGGRRNSNTVRRESDVPWTEAHKKQPESTVHVSMARNALETTRCENKSEEWYH